MITSLTARCTTCAITWVLHGSSFSPQRPPGTLLPFLCSARKRASHTKPRPFSTMQHGMPIAPAQSSPNKPMSAEKVQSHMVCLLKSCLAHSVVPNISMVTETLMFWNTNLVLQAA
jgi:hypothetical protein